LRYIHRKSVQKNIIVFAKKTVAAVSAFVLACSASLAVQIPNTTEIVYADQTVAKGQITAGNTSVNIRTLPKSNAGSSVICRKDGGFEFDILGTVNTSETYKWYKIGFSYNGTYTEGYVYGEYVTEIKNYSYEENTDFETYLTQQGFPESYKAGLRQLHAQYPEWKFVAKKTNVSWDTFIENESVSGRSLISGSSISSWKSIESGCYDWNTDTYVAMDSGNWVQASKELIEYCADPRNYLNSTNIFAFESLSYDSSTQTEDGISNIISSSFMSNSSHDLTYNGTSYNYATALILAAKNSGVSPYHLATRILQEQGTTGSGGSISGTESGFESLYNYYNIGAYAGGGLTAVQNGLKYAAKTDSATLRPWSTRMTALLGGALFIGNGYISIGQNTIYFEKFDVQSGKYYHQYMSNIYAALSESVTASKAYSEEFKQSTALTFYIPVYNDMPSSACAQPTGDGNPNNLLSDISVDGNTLTPTFNKYTYEYNVIVGSGVSSIKVGAEAISASASVSGTGSYSLKYGVNEIDITVTAGNGTTRTYTINVARGSTQSGSDGNVSSSRYSFDTENSLITGISVGTGVDDVLSNITFVSGGNAKMTDASGSAKTGSVATGDIVNVYDSSGNKLASYSAVVKGDVNGDGVIDILDIVRIKNQMLDTTLLSGAYMSAADIDGNGAVDLIDIVKAKNMILAQ
jgi:beta-N-acetylglucosaminidase